MMFRHDSYWWGVGLAIIIPGVFLGTLLLGFHFSGRYLSPELMENFLLLLLAINALVMRHALSVKKMDKMGKGILIPTFIFIMAYVIYYHL